MMAMNLICAGVFVALMVGFNIFLSRHYRFFVSNQF